MGEASGAGTTAVDPRSVAEEYLRLAAAGDAAGIAELYAEDAEFVPIPPFRIVVRGRDAIRKHYEAHVSSVRPEFLKLDWVVEGNKCVVEIESRPAGSDQIVQVVDVFTIADDGKIARMIAYKR
jgi:ketosteroid isomerase-like protein